MAGAKRTAKKKTTDTTGRIYQMKITLLGVEPGAWRRFAVQADIGLAKLHDVIQIVMGWENYHLHQFITKDRRSYLPASDEFDLNPDEADESKFRLCDLLKRARARMLYEYDFGDGWAHELVLEKIVPPEQGVRYPVCLAGERACPPEDCGGAWGYGNLLQVVGDPDHEDHEDALEWLGDDFDPEHFDLEEVNRTLRDYC